MDMRSIISGKIVLMSIIVLLIGNGCISAAVAAAPGPAMSAHLWINGLPQGQLIVVTVADHMQLNYVGGQGRYDFSIAGQPGETIRVLAGGREVQSFAFDAGAPAYLDLTYADGAITAGTYDPGVPMPMPYESPSIAPAPETEHTGIDLSGSWVFVIAIIMSLVVVGCFATVRRKVH
jgi:hypothetical protein